MFKSYLSIRPKGFQLSVFLFIWAGLYLIAVMLQPVIVHIFLNLSPRELADFATTSMARYPDFVIIINAMFTILAFGLPAFLFAYLAHPKAAFYLGFNFPKNKKQWIWMPVIVVGMIPVLMAIGGMIDQLNLGETATRLQDLREKQINTYLLGADGFDLIRNIFLLALLPAFCEELLFRGIIQKFTFSFWKNASGAIFISAFAFALIHLSVYSFLPIFLAGLILAWVYQQTGSIWLNISVHFLFNALQVVIAYFSIQNETLKSLDSKPIYFVLAILGGGFILWVALRNLYKLRTPFSKDWDVEDVDLREMKEE